MFVKRFSQRLTSGGLEAASSPSEDPLKSADEGPLQRSAFAASYETNGVTL